MYEWGKGVETFTADSVSEVLSSIHCLGRTIY